jgi:hypothetical protein
MPFEIETSKSREFLPWAVDLELRARVTRVKEGNEVVGGGPTLSVWYEDRECLRFDCFDSGRPRPHYHYAPAGKNAMYQIDPVLHPYPLKWVMELLQDRARLGIMLWHVDVDIEFMTFLHFKDTANTLKMVMQFLEHQRRVFPILITSS